MRDAAAMDDGIGALEDSPAVDILMGRKKERRSVKGVDGLKEEGDTQTLLSINATFHEEIIG